MKCMKNTARRKSCLVGSSPSLPLLLFPLLPFRLGSKEGKLTNISCTSWKSEPFMEIK